MMQTDDTRQALTRRAILWTRRNEASCLVWGKRSTPPAALGDHFHVEVLEVAGARR